MLDALPDVPELAPLMASAQSLTGTDLVRIANDGPEGELADTRVAQPLLYLTGWAWACALEQAGIRPSVAAGHSLGELTALAVAGVYDVEVGLSLVVERSRLMATAATETPGTMAAVLGMASETVADLVGPLDGVWVANDNAPGQIVLTGTHAGIEAATRSLSEAGARKIVPLQVAGPFHSPLMAPAAEAFAALLEDVTFAEATVPVIQNTSAEPATDPGILKQRLAAQITAPVRWTETMAALRAQEVHLMVEAGPGGVLAGLARRVEGLDAYAIESFTIAALREEIAQ
jgi:[acyl-carrier-protein] S-malonyltransferase